MRGPDNSPDHRDERLTLTVGGVSHQDWMRFSVDASFLTPAGAWELDVGTEYATLPAEVRPGARVVLSAGHDVLMTGLIDDITESLRRGRHELSIAGRDNAAALVDCSAPVFTAQNMTLQEVITRIVHPFGISKVAIRADKSVAPKKFSVEPGETAWEALQKVAEVNGLWSWVDPDGTFIIGGPDYSAPPVATLVLNRDGRNTILSLTRQRSIAGRYSEVTVLAQGHGSREHDGVHNRRGTATDSGFTLYRPLIQTMCDTDTDDMATARAKKLLSDSRLKALTLTVEVRGLRTPGGIPWTPGQRVNIQSDLYGIDGTFFMMSRRISGGRGQPLITTLTLKEDGVWIPDAYPRSRHKHKGKGKPRLWHTWQEIH